METNENVNNKGLYKVIIILSICVIVLLIGGFAFARYITKLNGTTTADIAKWSFKVNGSTNQNFVIDLANTRTGVTQEAEVQEGCIGPGTAGAFQIELDATGSEASLEYDINLNVDYTNNESFPKNLIFYTDSTMQNAIYHTDNNINLNGFIGWNNGSKVHTKTIYWKWDYETGSTQNEINTNDQLDSYWMGKPITLSMNVTAKQVNENPTTGQYAVTFDANGGTIQGYGNSSQATKMVTYGESYGALPTPTREGYTFQGWNGKNLLNYNEIPSYAQSFGICVNQNGNMGDSTPTEDPRNWNYSSSNWKFTLEQGTYQITIDFLEKATNSGAQQYSNLMLLDRSGIRFLMEYGSLYNVDKVTRTFTLNATTELGLEIKAYDGVYHIQIEKGSTSTKWEPYYVTTSTTVTQAKNHTLTAIWEPIQ